MREEPEPEAETKWFPLCQSDLPSPSDLIPLSQSLISPHLALAFNISPPNPPPIDPPSSPPDSIDPSRALKRPRLVWTPPLHKRFVDAVALLGIKHAVPKTIMQLMCVDGLTRENVASHLQKYRLYLKRMPIPIPHPFLSSHESYVQYYQRIGVPSVGLMQPPNCHGGDLGVGRRVLTLFPSGSED